MSVSQFSIMALTSSSLCFELFPEPNDTDDTDDRESSESDDPKNENDAS
jgi:hypothetical protein